MFRRSGSLLKNVSRGVAVSALLVAAALPVRAEQLSVVASFSVLGDMLEQVGGDRVNVTSLVGPDGDAHVFKPTPADARAVSKAAVMVVNGLDFEGWMERLLEAADFKGVLVTATEGVELIEYEAGGSHRDGHDKHEEHTRHDHAKLDEHKHDEHKHEHHAGHEHGEHKKKHEHEHEEHARHDGHAKHDGHHGHGHGEFDPHAWQDLANARVYARNIEAGLAKADPANAAYYRERLENYLKQIASLDAQIKADMAELPADRRTVVTSHDAFQYFGRAYGVTFLAPQGISTESEASAKGVAKLIRQIHTEKIKAVFVENLSDPRLVERIAEDTGVSIGGTLYPGALSPPGGPAATYLDMIRANARAIHQALKR